MSKLDLTLGAPSRVGKDCAEQVSRAFEGVVFPTEVSVQNLMPRVLRVPRYCGLALGHVADLKNCEKKFTFDSLDSLKDFAACVGSIADVGSYEKAIRISIEVADDVSEVEVADDVSEVEVADDVSEEKTESDSQEPEKAGEEAAAETETEKTESEGSKTTKSRSTRAK